MNNFKLSTGTTVTIKRAIEYFAAVNSGDALDYYKRHYCDKSFQLRYDLGKESVEGLQDLGFTFTDVKTLAKLMCV